MELIRLFGSGSDDAAEATAEGQRAPRLDAGEAGVSREVKLSPGGPAELLNISESGMLVEGKTRLPTGSKVLVTITGREQKRLTGRVVRCQVCAIHRDGTMTYQTALSLDQPAGLDNLSVETAEESVDAVAAVEAAVAAVEAAAPPQPAAPPQVASPPQVAVVPNPAPQLVNEW